MLKDIKVIDELITYITLYYPNAIILNINAYKTYAYSVTIKYDLSTKLGMKYKCFELQFKMLNNQLMFDDIYRLK